jgi:hypothetical protein
LNRKDAKSEAPILTKNLGGLRVFAVKIQGDKMMDHPITVGRVLRSSTAGFAIGCRVLREDVPEFGAFVKVAQGNTEITGLIYDVQFVDDPLVRQISVLVMGFARDGQVYQHLPPQPPATLDQIVTCTPDEVIAFTREFTFLRTILNAKDAPADELIAASLRIAAAARPESERHAFLLDAGRELARLLSVDPVRLEGILRRIKPGGR